MVNSFMFRQDCNGEFGPGYSYCSIWSALEQRENSGRGLVLTMVWLPSRNRFHDRFLWDSCFLQLTPFIVLPQEWRTEEYSMPINRTAIVPAEDYFKC